MFKKSLGKKLIAFVLAGCMVLPAANYLAMGDFWSLFSKTRVQAADDSPFPNTFITVGAPDKPEDGVYSERGKYSERAYYEVKDTNGNGVWDAGEDYVLLKNNPSSYYYTRFRKSLYYMYGDCGDGTGAMSNSGYSKLRYNTSGERLSIDSIKTNPSATLGSEGNPCVVLEIVPDDFAMQMSFFVKGQEIYDQVYANLLTQAQGGTTSDFGVLRTYENLLQEHIDVPDAGKNTGIWYSADTFIKVVLGLGYRNQELAQAPLIDAYTFKGWYVNTDADGNVAANGNVFNENLFSTDNLTTKYSFGEQATENIDLHVYARWGMEAFDDNTSDSTVVYSDETKCYVDGTELKYNFETAKTYTVSSQNGISGVKVQTKDGEKIFKSITFHYALPTGVVKVDVDGDGVFGQIEPEEVDADNDGLIGEHEEISLDPKAKVSFENDYDFANKTIDLVGRVGADSNFKAPYSLINNDYIMWYPSLMGNTDWAILDPGTNKGYVEVITVPASEFKTGDHSFYENYLDKVDLIFIPDKGYSGLYNDFTDLAKSFGKVSDAQKVQTLKYLLRPEIAKDIYTEVISGTTFKTDSKLYMAGNGADDGRTDIEAYAVLRMMKNMAGDNSSGKLVPILTQSTILNADVEVSNVKKMLRFAYSNSDISVAWKEYKNNITIVSGSDVAAYSAQNFKASDNTLVFKDARGDQWKDSWYESSGLIFWPYTGENINGNDWHPSQGLSMIPRGESVTSFTITHKHEGTNDSFDTTNWSAFNPWNYGTVEDRIAAYEAFVVGVTSNTEGNVTIVTTITEDITNLPGGGFEKVKTISETKSYSDYDKILREGWLYNGSFDGDAGYTSNTRLSSSLMVYNSNTSLVQMFLKTGDFQAPAMDGDGNYIAGSNSHRWNTDGYEYLKQEGSIKNGTSVITTALALRSLMFSGGGRLDQLIIDNSSSTYSDGNSGSNIIYVVNDFTGIGSTKLLYHLDTNFGTDYYMEYYKIKDTGNFKTDYKEAIKSGNADRMVLSDSTGTAGVLTYARKADSLELDFAKTKSIENFSFKRPGETTAQDIPMVHLDNKQEHDDEHRAEDNKYIDGRLVGTLLNSTSVDANHKDKYVIVAHHEDGQFIAYAYVEISISSSPFNLD